MATETVDPMKSVTSDPAPEAREAAGELLVAFGRRIVQLRQEKDWSQAELAQRLGVSRERLGHWERGEHNPPLAVLWALRRELEVSIDELVTGEPAPPVGLSREQRDRAMKHLAALTKLIR